jgi:spore germination cell wall hydrolase CwlJ-like protein
MRLASDFYWGVATVWAEARGEPHAGRIAVGEVIRNRARKHNWSIAKVVLEPLQFSCWNAHDPNRDHAATIDDMDPVVVECANAWLAAKDSDLTEGALNYFNPKISQPSWGPEMLHPIKIGSHVFGVAP